VLSGDGCGEVFSGPYRLVLPDGTSGRGTLWLAADPRRLPTPSAER